MRFTCMFLVTRDIREAISSVKYIFWYYAKDVNTKLLKKSWISHKKTSILNVATPTCRISCVKDSKSKVIPWVPQTLLLSLCPPQLCKYPDHILLHLGSLVPVTGHHPKPGWPMKRLKKIKADLYYLHLLQSRIITTLLCCRSKHTNNNVVLWICYVYVT